MGLISDFFSGNTKLRYVLMHSYADGVRVLELGGRSHGLDRTAKSQRQICRSHQWTFPSLLMGTLARPHHPSPQNKFQPQDYPTGPHHRTHTC